MSQELQDYYKELSMIQNRFPHIDIMTITGMMNWEEKVKHLNFYKNQVKDN